MFFKEEGGATIFWEPWCEDEQHWPGRLPMQGMSLLQNLETSFSSLGLTGAATESSWASHITSLHLSLFNYK